MGDTDTENDRGATEAIFVSEKAKFDSGKQ